MRTRVPIRWEELGRPLRLSGALVWKLKEAEAEK